MAINEDLMARTMGVLLGVAGAKILELKDRIRPDSPKQKILDETADKASGLIDEWVDEIKRIREEIDKAELEERSRPAVECLHEHRQHISGYAICLNCNKIL